MWFFTGKGDSGNTNLYDGSKVTKDNPTFDLIGTIDEVNAYIGLAISSNERFELKKDLQMIQTTLSKVMGVIAGASVSAINEFNVEKSIEWLEDKLTFYGRELDNPRIDKNILAYMNRLSSFFYILRLLADKDANTSR